MALSPEEFAEVIRLVCPMCRAGRMATVRDDTGEFVHNETTPAGGGIRFETQLCWASDLRRSRFNPATKAD